MSEGRVHEIAEVVIADGLAGEPGIGRWKVGTLEDAVHEGEVHGLLGVDDLRRVAADRSPESEYQGKDDLRRQHEPPAATQKLQGLAPPSP